MTAEERVEELGNALGSVYRVRMDTSYDDLGQIGVTEIAVAEMMIHRARHRAMGKPASAGWPSTLTGIRREIEQFARG